MWSVALFVMILLSHCESYPGLDRRGRRDGRPGDEDRHGGDEQQDDGAHASIWLSAVKTLKERMKGGWSLHNVRKSISLLDCCRELVLWSSWIYDRKCIWYDTKLKLRTGPKNGSGMFSHQSTFDERKWFWPFDKKIMAGNTEEPVATAPAPPSARPSSVTSRIISSYGQELLPSPPTL